MNIYKYAAQNNLRFPSIKGDLMVNDLFDLPLTSKSGFDLDSVARAVNGELRGATEESFVATTPNPRQKPLEIALDVVKDVIATKQEANAAELLRKTRAEQRKKLLDAMAAKQDHALTTASMEELERQLAALDEPTPAVAVA